MYCDVVNVQPHFNLSDEIIKSSWILKYRRQKTKQRCYWPWWRHADQVGSNPLEETPDPLCLQDVSESTNTTKLFKPLSVAGWHNPTEWGTQHWPGSKVPHCSLTNFTSSFTSSEYCFPAPSSKLCQIWLHHWRGTLYLCTAVHPVCTLRKVGVLIWLWKQPSAQACT